MDSVHAKNEPRTSWIIKTRHTLNQSSSNPNQGWCSWNIASNSMSSTARSICCLYLIKRDELDIYDIPICTNHRQLHAVRQHAQGMSKEDGLDINVAGDFLVMAATLMEIKSATLLPKPPAAGIDDRRNDRGAGTGRPALRAGAEAARIQAFQGLRHAARAPAAAAPEPLPAIPRQARRRSDEPPPVDLDEVQIWDLLDAFNRLMKEVGVRKPRFHEVTYDDTPIDLHAADIEDRLKREGTADASAAGHRPKEPQRDDRRVPRPARTDPREENSRRSRRKSSAKWKSSPRPEEHRRTYSHASLHLVQETEDEETPPAPEEQPPPPVQAEDDQSTM